MTEREAHLKLSKIEIDNDNLDYMKLVGAIVGKLRYDLVKLFCQPDVSGNEANPLTGFAELWQALDNINAEKYETAKELIRKYIYSAKNKKDGEVAVCEHDWQTMYDGSNFFHCTKCDKYKRAN